MGQFGHFHVMGCVWVAGSARLLRQLMLARNLVDPVAYSPERQKRKDNLFLKFELRLISGLDIETGNLGPAMLSVLHTDHLKSTGIVPPKASSKTHFGIGIKALRFKICPATHNKFLLTQLFGRNQIINLCLLFGAAEKPLH